MPPSGYVQETLSAETFRKHSDTAAHIPVAQRHLVGVRKCGDSLPEVKACQDILRCTTRAISEGQALLHVFRTCELVYPPKLRPGKKVHIDRIQARAAPPAIPVGDSELAWDINVGVKVVHIPGRTAMTFAPQGAKDIIYPFPVDLSHRLPEGKAVGGQLQRDDFGCQHIDPFCEELIVSPVPVDDLQHVE